MHIRRLAAILGTVWMMGACGAAPGTVGGDEDLADRSQSASLWVGAGPAQIVVATSAQVRDLCAGEVFATYCSAADRATAVDACRRRLPSDLRVRCALSGCLSDYTAVRDHCVAGPAYPTPASCDDPVPDDCAFYRRCLEAAQPCGPSGYALGFGERLCFAFIARRGEFSAAGQAWLRGVRACLQRVLVPALHAPALACRSLGDTAYATHAGCYTAKENSICALPSTDFLALANVLSVDLLDPRAIRQMAEVANHCLRHSLRPDADPAEADRAAFYRAFAAAATDSPSLRRFVEDRLADPAFR